MRVDANGIEVEVEQHGPSNGNPLLMICGIGQQLTYWPPDLIEHFVAAGFRVITFDNRDVGLSTWATDPPPSIDELFADASSANYSLWDMADDAASVLDALDVEQADVLGHSMGGMIAQCFASRHSQRTRSLALWGTSPGDGTGESAPAFAERMVTPRPEAFEEQVAYDIDGWRRFIVHPQRVDHAELEAHTRRQLERRPNRRSQHLMAILATGDRSDHLRDLHCPTVVIHGTGDLAIGPSGGESLAKLIPDADLVLIDDMGHRSFDPDTNRRIGEAVLVNITRVR